MSAMTGFPSVTRMAGAAMIASPSSAFREQVMDRLNGRCRPVQQALGGADALAKLEKGDWQVLFLDRRVSDLDIEELTAIIQRRFPGIQVVLLDSDGASASSHAGREKDRDRKNEHTIGEAFSRSEKMPEASSGESSLRMSVNPEGVAEMVRYKPLPGMIGHGAAMQRVYRLARLVAPRTTTVLIAGATGSGKELVARALHELSPRAGKPFIAVNCAAIPEALLESELFGHARGAFTGAVQAQVGRIPAAHGGTLFLDEVSELPLGMQAKLLRFLEQKEVQRLGATEVTRVDVRVVAASNIDLAARASRGEFRADLFYRLSAFPLELPPLCERHDDIIPLAEHFLACMSAAMNVPCPRLAGETVHVLKGHPWRGNVRELQHVMERASILVENGELILPEHLLFPFQAFPSNPPALHHSCATLAS